MDYSLNDREVHILKEISILANSLYDDDFILEISSIIEKAINERHISENDYEKLSKILVVTSDIEKTVNEDYRLSEEDYLEHKNYKTIINQRKKILGFMQQLAAKFQYLRMTESSKSDIRNTNTNKQIKRNAQIM